MCTTRILFHTRNKHWKIQNELEHLKGGVTYQVLDESNDGASGEEGEYFYAIG